MVDATPTFPMLLQRFFAEHLRHHRAVSPHTVAAYRDAFRLLLKFAQARTGKAPTDLALADLDASLILAFLDHLERERKSSVRSRNARLSAIRSFLKYAAHEDLTALATIERCLAVPQKRHDKAVLGFLTRPEMEAVIAAPDRQTWAGARDRALFALLYNTGARVSEAVDLKVGDVVLDVSPVAHLHGKAGSEEACRSGSPRPRCSDDGSVSCRMPPRRRTCSRAARVEGCRGRASRNGWGLR